MVPPVDVSLRNRALYPTVSAALKVMESLIRDKLVKHMTEGRFFCDAQHGFVPGRSCMTQLLVTLELWTAWLDKGESIDVVYLDFKKAFDSVPHLRLLHKLKAYGIDGNLCKWIEHFLLDSMEGNVR